MQIQVIDPLAVPIRQRLRSVFVVRALRALERLAPAHPPDWSRASAMCLNGPKGTVGPRMHHRSGIAPTAPASAPRRAPSRLITALDDALEVALVRRIDSAREAPVWRVRHTACAARSPGQA
jgi:hypothetical protein